MAKLIGLSGYARAGKDTVAGLLVNDHDYLQFSFAEPMRHALFALNPLVGTGTRLQDVIASYGWEGYKQSIYGQEIRELMQRFGTEVGRNQFDENFWVDLSIAQIPDLLAMGQSVVFSDVRFPNEYAAIKELGGQVWRIIRDDAKPANLHKSEIALDAFEFDRYLYNNDSLKELSWMVAENA